MLLMKGDLQMRCFIVTCLMVLMLCLIAPRAAFAHCPLDSAPILTMTTDKLASIVTANQNDYSEVDLTTEKVALKTRCHQVIIKNKITMIDKATIGNDMTDKAGGAAILASGQPRFSLLT